jgi:Sec7-like guanine-nucleotide exchange factor
MTTHQGTKHSNKASLHFASPFDASLSSVRSTRRLATCSAHSVLQSTHLISVLRSSALIKVAIRDSLADVVLSVYATEVSLDVGHGAELVRPDEATVEVLAKV